MAKKIGHITVKTKNRKVLFTLSQMQDYVENCRKQLDLFPAVNPEYDRILSRMHTMEVAMNMVAFGMSSKYAKP